MTPFYRVFSTFPHPLQNPVENHLDQNQDTQLSASDPRQPSLFVLDSNTTEEFEARSEPIAPPETPETPAPDSRVTEALEWVESQRWIDKPLAQDSIRSGLTKEATKLGVGISQLYDAIKNAIVIAHDKTHLRPRTWGWFLGICRRAAVEKPKCRGLSRSEWYSMNSSERVAWQNANPGEVAS